MSKRRYTSTGRGQSGSRTAGYVAVLLLLILSIVIIGLCAFMRITDIKVKGAGNYSSDEVIEYSQIKNGSILFLLNSDRVAEHITENLPYLESVEIVKQYPDTVIIEVNECFPIAAFKYQNEYWITDKNCKLLIQSKNLSEYNALEIKGADLIEPEEGKTAKVEKDNEIFVSYLSEILNAMVDENIKNDVTYIDLSQLTEIKFDYKGRFVVKLGRGDNADQKIRLMVNVADSIESNAAGTIEILSEKEAHFLRNN